MVQAPGRANSSSPSPPHPPVLLMGEHLSPITPVAALAVLLCVVSTQRART
ncbi:hypothetical protein [Actinacidiphila yanglinensis]|nr:hypothetical protein [Actinacidiphila yanglinensis]